MNVLELSLVPNTIRAGDFAVAIRIDGELLTERVRRIEAASRRAFGADPNRIRYIWVWAQSMLLPSRHLLGIPATPWCPGFSEVLVCNCGEAGCGAIAVGVRLWPVRVGWLSWRQFPLVEASSLCEFRPLLFNRVQYEAELTRVSQEYVQTNRPG